MDTSPDSLALWDQVLNMQAVIATVAYNGRNLNVWKDSRDSGHIRIRSWDSSIVKLVEKELINKGHPTSITIKMASGEVNVPCEILPLPMQMVRINAADFMQTYLDLNWRPNQNQPNKMTFELCSSNKDDCNKLLDDAKANPETFLLNTKLKFEFTLKGNRQEYREFKVTSEALSESSFFSELSNKFGNKDVDVKSGFDYSKTTNSINMNELVNDSNSSLSIDQLQNRINQNKMHVEWKGQKFEQKNLELYRVNLQSFKDRRDIFFKGVTLISVAKTYQIEILPEIPDLFPALVENILMPKQEILIPEQDILMPEISPIEMTRNTIECKKYNKIYAFGGSVKKEEEEFTIAIFDTNNNQWMKKNQQFESIKRIDHTTVVYNRKAYLWGGLYWGKSSNLSIENQSGYFIEIDVLKQDGFCHSTMKNFTHSLYLHTAVVYKDSMYVFGGAKNLFHFKYNCFNNETIMFHFPTKIWSIVNTTERPPSAREKHTACIHDNRMYIFFGSIFLKKDDLKDQDENIIKYLDLDTYQWHKKQTLREFPCARYDHATLEYNGKIYLFGGYYKGKIFNDLYEFDPITNTWTKLILIGNEPPGIRRMSLEPVKNRSGT
uniref:Kelch repeat-containing protein n=1 Tax=Acrobeloides nanus TaxID=290746 RepID=A0A914DHW5_9BILA